MPAQPFISICIPVYEGPQLLRRLLQSIQTQTYKNIEVIVRDDSQSADAQIVCGEFDMILKLQYHKNSTALGSPANWNASLKMAKGQWLKIMHQDDWFTNENSLQAFATAAQHTSSQFIFSAFTTIYQNGENNAAKKLSANDVQQLNEKPLKLLYKNIIGNPSTVMVHSALKLFYDENLKWVVDFEYYLRAARQTKFDYVVDNLVCLGDHDAQITKKVFHKPEVEIPENIYLLKQHGSRILNDIKIYDHYWRMFRNVKVRGVQDAQQYVNTPLPKAIKVMLAFQKHISPALLAFGVTSKFFMSLSFLQQKLIGDLR